MGTTFGTSYANAIQRNSLSESLDRYLALDPEFQRAAHSRRHWSVWLRTRSVAMACCPYSLVGSPDHAQPEADQLGVEW